MRLIIAEKPKMGREIANYLPGQKTNHGDHIVCGNTTVSWCFGHILEQKMPDEYNPGWKQWTMDTLPMVPDWSLKVKPDAKKQFDLLKKLIGEASEIVNAGDPDREGQLLVDEVLYFVGNTKPVNRLWLPAWDEDSVKKALSNIKPNSDYYGYYKAALARSRADWMVGLNLTRAFTIAGRQGGYDGVLSVGRVQTPTLALIVKRDEIIEKHKQITHYGVAGAFNHANGLISAKWQSGEEMITDKSVADAVAAEIVRNNLGKVTEYEVKDGKTAAPLPFNLAKLQIAASKQFGFSAQKTLDIAQALYETHKATTYPRSDCQYLPHSQHGDCSKIMASLPDELTRIMDASKKHAAFNDEKVTAHHAIVPTGVKPDNLSADEQKLFDLICKSYAAIFSPSAEYQTTKIIMNIGAYSFSASNKIYTNLGWKAIYANGDEDEEGAEKLPVCEIGDRIECARADVTQTQTKPPSRYNDALLIDAMSNIYRHIDDPEMKARLKETAGLGTEATRAPIIEELVKKGLVKREKGKGKAEQLISTEVGRKLVAALPEKLTSPALTAYFETMLESVMEDSTVEEFLELQERFTRKMIDVAKETTINLVQHACPKCKAALRKRTRKDGKGVFWACSAYPTCNYACNDAKGKPTFDNKK